MSIEVPIIILILSIPLYFFSKLILKKMRFGNDKNRKYFALIFTIVISPILYIGIILIWIFLISYYPQTDFSKKKWETNIEERYKMSKNIIEKEILIGKTKEEVIELLGGDYYSYDINHIGYYIGFVPELCNIDSDVLDIYFINGKVAKVEQRRT